LFTVFTIADERFLPGLAGLVNSLRAVGFKGQIVVGTPAPLPVLNGVPGVRVVRLDHEGLWLGFLKPALLLREAVDQFVFLDADVVVANDTFLPRVEAFTEDGPVFALEGLVGPRDHRRLRWAARLTLPMPRVDAWAHYNGGFLAGRMARDRSLLEDWASGMERVLSRVDGYFQDDDFPLGDQDVLNALAQVRTDPVVSLQFPDWWSAVAPLNAFLHFGAFKETAFYHSTGAKPWNLERVPPRAPTPYESRWFRHVVMEPSPMRVPCRLPGPVCRWLEGSWSGRFVSRASRVGRRLKTW
jgi:hypothetical protein